MLRRMTDGEVARAIKSVLERIAVASQKRSKEVENTSKQPRLVAVSKTKPRELIIEAYTAGQRNFGENYVKELLEKAHDDQVQALCPDIRWHVIGHVQSNKVRKVASIPNLYIVETVDSEKLASAFNTTWNQLKKKERLKVFVQVNTSGEESKSGVHPDEVVNLIRHVLQNCPNLEFLGLMTIGIFDYDLSKGPNPDFQVLIRCREKICKEYGLSLSDVELSMGMSADFEHAVEVGSTNVRVGSTIFGARNYS